jgi:N-acetyl-alpha-D-glucosaminyl L-malate synthase BshA
MSPPVPAPPAPARPLAIASVSLPALGGSGVVAMELAAGLCARGHRVHVIATELAERARAAGVAFERVEVARTAALEHGPYGLAVACRIVELCRREAIDVVHLHYAVPHAESALVAAQVLGAAAPAFVMTLHGTDVTQLAQHPGVHPVTAHAVAACAAVTAPSEYLRAAAVRALGLPAEQIQVIPNFVDLSRFAPPAIRAAGRAPAPPVLFHVSNFRAVKRTPDLIEVLARVRARLPAQLVLVGDGPERARAQERAVALGLADHVTFLGRRDDFAPLLAESDAFVLTSSSESFGVAAAEALAAGVPVFGYRVGGLPEVVVTGTGALVPCCDVDGLAAAIVHGISDPARRAALGAAARAQAEARFATGRALAAYEACYQRALERARARPAREAAR